MTTPTSPEYAAELATILAGSWPRSKIGDVTCLVWARVLERVTEDVAEEAVDRASRFEGPPTKVELETAARAARETLHPELPLEPTTTGRIITLDEWRHGSFHLRRYWRTGATVDLRDPDEFERALHPWDCDCHDWQVVPEVDVVEAVVE